MSTDTPTHDQCRAQRPRPANTPPNTRIVHCDLPRGHDGDHCESDTETTWAAETGTDTPTTPAEARRRREWADALRWAADRAAEPFGYVQDGDADSTDLRRLAVAIESGAVTPWTEEEAGPTPTTPAEALDDDALDAIESRYRTACDVRSDASADELSRITTACASAADVPALAAEVRRLRGEQDAWLRWVDEQVTAAQAGETRAVTRAEAAEVEAERLRGDVASLRYWGGIHVQRAEDAEARAAVAEAQVRRLAAWLDEHVPARWHRGGTPVDIAVAMLASWSDRGVLATALREVGGERDGVRAELSRMAGDLDDRDGTLAIRDAAIRRLRARVAELEQSLRETALGWYRTLVAEQDAPTTWQLPPEPGEHVQAVQDHAGRIHTRHHGSWVDPDGSYRQWRTLLYERGEVSATPPARTEVCAHLCAGPYGEDMCDREKAAQAPCRGCPEAPPAGTEVQ